MKEVNIKILKKSTKKPTISYFDELIKKEIEEEKKNLFELTTPSIGIFWLRIKNKKIDVVSYRCKYIKDGRISGNYIYSTDVHKKFWANLKRIRAISKNNKYTDLPRGQVIFNKKINKFIVLLGDYLIDNIEVKREITEKFNLISEYTEWKTRSYYSNFKTWEIKLLGE